MQAAIPLNEPAEITFTTNIPDMPRVWFISQDDTCLVQLQPDRFLFNWREGPQAAAYPRYPVVIKKFRTLFSSFEKFLAKNKIGSASPQHLELSYINHVKQSAHWSALADIGEVFPDLSWRRKKRFLSTPEGIGFRSNHSMDAGKLSINIVSAQMKTDRSPMFRFDLHARGNVSEIGDTNVWAWFDKANTWIVDAFIDMTSDPMQHDVWKRLK